MVDKKMIRERHDADVYFLVEGLVDSKVVVTHRVMPTHRIGQVRLRVDNEGIGLRADGSDFVTVVAEIIGKNGNTKCLNNHCIKFFVEGEGRILGGANVLADPTLVKWSSAPVLIRLITIPGKTKARTSVSFEGSQMPVSGELELTSPAPMYPLIFDKKEEALPKPSELLSMDKKSDAELELERRRHELDELKLKGVEQQQTDFGKKVD